MPPSKKLDPPPPLSSILASSAFQDLSARDLLAIELAKAYLSFHGKLAPDVIKDTVVASANELAYQLEWVKDRKGNR